MQPPLSWNSLWSLRPSVESLTTHQPHIARAFVHIAMPLITSAMRLSNLHHHNCLLRDGLQRLLVQDSYFLSSTSLGKMHALSC